MGGGVHRGLMWADGGGVTALGGWGNRVGGQQCRGLQPLRTALHTIGISLQNSLS